jgi:hypothetical protein
VSSGQDEEVEYCLALIEFDIENTGDLPLWIEDIHLYVDGEDCDWSYHHDYVLPGELILFSEDLWSAYLTPGTHPLTITFEDDGAAIYSYSTTVTVGS